MSDVLELELQMFVGYHVFARTEPRSTTRAINVLKILTTLQQGSSLYYITGY